MKRPKDRLHRVIVIGATPSGIAATNKLGELGVPVTLVDSDADFDMKLGREDWKLESGVGLNYAHRPGLIRILRNPQIQCILPASITSIKHSPQGFRVNIKETRTFVDSEKCTLCGRCKDVCPLEMRDSEKAIQINSRFSLPGRPVIDKRQVPLCQDACPLGVNAQGYVALAGKGLYREALDLIRRDNIFPGICGRICTHPCEAACRRGDLDAPVAIRDIKRFIADQDTHTCNDPDSVENNHRKSESKGHKIAIIGSGPAGLAAAADLARAGQQVTVFEKEKKAGGLLRYGIGAHRLSREILEKEIAYVERMGVTIKTSHPVDLTNDLKKLQQDYKSVIIAAGSWTDRQLGVPGEDLDGVDGCLSFLNRFHRGEIQRVEENVAVIGDGNAAFDLARTLRRAGADVTLLSWFPEAMIPADPEEIKEAREEGVNIIDSLQTTAFKGNGKLVRIRLEPTEPGEPDANGIPWPVKKAGGEPVFLEFNRAFVAIGQKGALKADAGTYDFEVRPNGSICTDENLSTSMKGVYAAGDAVSGPSSVVEAMAGGRKAALTVLNDISGATVFNRNRNNRPQRPADKDFSEIPPNIPHLARAVMPEKQLSERVDNFMEVAMGLNASQVVSETGRCLQCGVCSECLECEKVCDAIGAINHTASVEDSVEHSGVIIIADPDMAPDIKGEDVIRAYGPKAAKTDVNAMFIRGYASAAQAMVLLDKNSRRPKGHGISFLPPDQGISPVARLGVFVCRCNDSLGWLKEMDDYVTSLSGLKNVIHAETVNAACTPEGSADILRTIRNKGLTRVVLASCVCCPLNFICNACTDQKSRLKEALFTATGISRSVVETCNIRGEALRFVKSNPEMARATFEGMINRSVARARKLKALPALARNYNLATAVIGNSESAESSAFTLADAGQEVFWFSTPGTTPADPPVHLNIHNFKEAVITCISGTIGEFRISFKIDEFEQTLHVGAVIIGEKARKAVPYVYQEGLPGIMIKSGRQVLGKTGIPFFYPGATSIPGLFLSDPPGIHVSRRKKGAAAAVQAAAIMPRGPRQSKGFTVVVDEKLCRSCGRCMVACPYQAITLKKNDALDFWYASVDEALCKGCGNCIAVCPTNAADSPYRNQLILEETIKELLVN